MEWKKKNKYKTISEVVLHNMNTTETELKSWSSKEYVIKNITKAVKLIKEFKEKVIYVIGDYDTDGITSTFILVRALRKMGYTVYYRIPKRITEGYGLNPTIIDDITITDALLITVDNGIKANEAIQKAKEKGLTVLIIDHHLANRDELPNADLIIDPHIEDISTFKDYCGAGLSYKLISNMTNDKNLLDISLSAACIGTIADVMPLVEDNRNIVKNGLKTLISSSGRNCGLYCLLESLDLQEIITEGDIGFKLAPCLNAGERMYNGGSMTITECLLLDDDISVGRKNSKAIINVNEYRKKSKENGLLKVKMNIAENKLTNDYPLMIYEPNLNEGVVGIIAGKIAEIMKRPTIIVTDSHDKDILKGSGRSYGDFDLFENLSLIKDEFYKFGGHAGACGCSIRRDNFEQCKKELQKRCTTVFEDDNNILYDLEINYEDIENKYNELKEYAPFGNGNEKVVFLIKNFKIFPKYNKYFSIMGDKQQHIKFFGKNVDAIAFDSTEKYQAMGNPKTLDIIGTLSTNHYKGKSTIQIEVIDFKKTKEEQLVTPLQLQLEQIANR